MDIWDIIYFLARLNIILFLFRFSFDFIIFLWDLIKQFIYSKGE